MALSVHCGSFNITTTDSGTIAVTGVGFQPGLVEFIGQAAAGTATGVVAGDANVGFMYGATDGTNQFVASTAMQDNVSPSNTARSINTNRCLASVNVGGASLDFEYSVSSLDSDGFTLTVNSAPGTNTTIFYRALAGADFEVGNFNTPTGTTGNKDVTTAFDPKLVKLYTVGTSTTTGAQTAHFLTMGVSDGTTHYLISTSSGDGLNPTAPRRAQISGYMQRYINSFGGTWFTGVPVATTCAMGTSKFTLNYTDVHATNAGLVCYVAYGGVDAELAIDTEPATDTTVDTALTFTPETVELLSYGSTSSTAINNYALTTVGFSDGTNHRAVMFADNYNASTSDEEYARSDADAIFYRNPNGTNVGDATATLQTNNLRTTWANTSGALREFIVLALADSTSGTTVSVPVASLGLAGLAPTVAISDHQTIAIPTADLTLTGYAPAVLIGNDVSIEVPTGNLSLVGNSPTIFTPKTIEVPTGSVTFTGQAPVIAIGAEVVVDPATGNITLTGQAPTINSIADVTITVPVGELLLTGLVPVMGGAVVVTDDAILYVTAERSILYVTGNF